MRKSSITLTYDTEANDDGTGAQVQRILGIYAICKKYGFNYLHTPIKNLVTHPLDSFQNSDELEEYLSRVNDYFRLPTSGPLRFDNIYTKATVSKGYLRKIQLLKHIGKQKNVLLKISNPARITDVSPDMFRLAVSDLTVPTFKKLHSTISVILHIRRCVHESFVINGESQVRSLPTNYYLEKLRNIVNSLDMGSKYEVYVFTDIPKEKFEYQPRPQDMNVWNRAGHQFVEGKIQVDSEDLEKEFQEFKDNIKFAYGGDPLDALIQMSTADYFIMSRSSLSYLAGILNHSGKIFYPPRFWCSPLSNWIP